MCGRITKRPIFAFLDSSVRPNDALQVFALEDDYSFGVLQSSIHWKWFLAKCSTLTDRYRYTSDTVFDTYPWPQSPTKKAVRAVAKAAKVLRDSRRKIMHSNSWSLREVYRTLELPGEHSLKKAQGTLDDTVRAAYGMRKAYDPLEFLLNLNLELAARGPTRTEALRSVDSPPDLVARPRRGDRAADRLLVEYAEPPLVQSEELGHVGEAVIGQGGRRDRSRDEEEQENEDRTG